MTMRPYALVLCFFIVPVAARADVEVGEVTIRVVDSESKDRIPARLALRAADGTYPGDRIGLVRDKWPNLEARGMFIAGETKISFPTGKTLITASAGPQYEVLRREIEVVARKATTVDFRLKRRLDLRKRGWICGDAHLHMIHGEMQRETSYAEIATTCRASGLDWAYVNQEYGGAGDQSLQGFHAACQKVSDERFQLLLGAERPKSLLGHNALIGVPNPFIVPDDPPYHKAAAAIHAQGGVLFAVHPLRYFPGKQYQGQWLDFPGNNLGREIIFDAYLGPSFDGLSVLSDEPNDLRAHQLWFNLLNKDFFVPAFADSDACFDRPTLQKNVPGFWATYLFVGNDGKPDNVSLADAVRKGRTIATTGPLLVWNIDGKMSGDTLPVDGKPCEIKIEAWHAHHNWTLEDARVAKVELIRNGRVVRVWEPNLPDVTLTHTVNEREACWYAVRVWGTDQRWQVGIGSPIYFAKKPVAAKREPLTVRIRGRVYDFVTGQEERAKISVQRHGKLLKEFQAEGQFAVDMPLDASITAEGEGGKSVSHDLLLDNAQVHRFLHQLDSEALSKPETLDRFEAMMQQVDLQFPLGYRMAGCYAAKELESGIDFQSLKVVDGPKGAEGPVAVAMVLLDKRHVQAGDVIHAAVLFHDQGDSANKGEELLVMEGRAYDPRRPSGFNPLKVVDSFEMKWSRAAESGEGFRCITGKLTVPSWVDAGPVHSIEINVFARGVGGRFDSRVGLRVPLGATEHALMVTSTWPTIPISWHDHNYGIGPLKVCGKNGRIGQSKADYRSVRLEVTTSASKYVVHPHDDCRGCADADDAVFTEHFLDQILNWESKLLPSVTHRPQPKVEWRKTIVIDATTRQME